MTKFGDLTYQEIKALPKKETLVILPTGCTEQQGPHLPVDFDTWFVETLCNAASDKIKQDSGKNILVLPTPPYGPTTEHIGFETGYVHIPQEIYLKYIGSIFESVIAQGFHRILVWRGCGGHHLDELVKSFEIRYPNVEFIQPEMPYYSVWCKFADPDIPGGHADSFGTAISMYLRPDSVRKLLIENPHNSPVDWDNSQLDFSKYSTTGVIGDPTHATPELGEALWHAVVEEASKIIRTTLE